MIKMSLEGKVNRNYIDKEKIDFLIERVMFRLEEILRNFNLFEHLKDDYYKRFIYSEIINDLKENLNDLYKDKKRFKGIGLFNKMQLSSYENITSDNIIFNEAKEYNVKDSKIRYKRIPIEVKYPNGKKGPLVIETPLLFSFGVNEKKNQKTNKLVGL